jgi:hypothetical protein
MTLPKVEPFGGDARRTSPRTTRRRSPLVDRRDAEPRKATMSTIAEDVAADPPSRAAKKPPLTTSTSDIRRSSWSSCLLCMFNAGVVVLIVLLAVAMTWRNAMQQLASDDMLEAELEKLTADVRNLSERVIPTLLGDDE